MAKTFEKLTDGNSVDVVLEYTVTGERPILVDGMVGLPNGSGVSGDTIAMTCDGSVHEWAAPAGLSLSVGDTVYVDISDTGSAHDVPDGGFTTTAGGDTVALFRVLEEKDANDVCIVKLINF